MPTDFSLSKFIFYLSLAGNVCSIVGMIYIFRKKVKKFSWWEVKTGSKKVLNAVISQFAPDLILTLSSQGTLVASLGLVLLDKNIPLITGITVRKGATPQFSLQSEYMSISTERWDIYIPKTILAYTNHKVLLFDDCTLSGNSFEEARKMLAVNGIHSSKVKTASLILSKIARQFHHGVDYFGYIVDEYYFDFPWGDGYSDQYYL